MFTGKNGSQPLVGPDSTTDARSSSGDCETNETGRTDVPLDGGVAAPSQKGGVAPGCRFGVTLTLNTRHQGLLRQGRTHGPV